MATETVYTRAFQQAERAVGGPLCLQQFLRVPVSDLCRWKSGESVPPMPVFLKLVDLLADESCTAEAGH
jgi:hypothetical protein